MEKKGGGVGMGKKEKKRPTLPFKKIANSVLKISRRLVKISRRLVKISRRLVKKRLDLFQKTSGFFFGSSFAQVLTSDFGDFCQVILHPVPHPADTKKGAHEGHLHRKFNQPVKAYSSWGLFQHTLDIIFGQLRDIVAHRCIALQIL